MGGFVSDAFSEVPHDPPMLSLGNVFSEEDLIDFDKRCRKNLDFEGDIEFSMELGAASDYDINLEVVIDMPHGERYKGKEISSPLATTRLFMSLLFIKPITRSPCVISNTSSFFFSINCAASLIVFSAEHLRLGFVINEIG